MAEYNDLIKRLRRYTENCVAYKLDADFAIAVQEAADSIEKLEAYADLYKDGGETAMKVANDYKDQIAALRATVKRQSHIIEAKDRDLKRAIDAQPRWTSVTDKLPESGGSYIVYLRPLKGKTDLGYVIGDLSYPTEMYFDKGQMLWVGENESYNAVLSAVDTETEYHVTHWMKMPEAPKEEQE